jgi:hypothetical protein
MQTRMPARPITRNAAPTCKPLHTLLHIHTSFRSQVAESAGGDATAGGGGEPGAKRYRHVVDAAVVKDKVGALLKKQDLSKFIL